MEGAVTALEAVKLNGKERIRRKLELRRSNASGTMEDKRTRRLRSRKAKRDTAIEKSRREEG